MYVQRVQGTQAVKSFTFPWAAMVLEKNELCQMFLPIHFYLDNYFLIEYLIISIFEKY